MWDYDFNLTGGSYSPYSNLNLIPFMSRGLQYGGKTHANATDIYEVDGKYIIKIAIAGANKDDLKIKVIGNKLIIKVFLHEEKRDEYILKEIPFCGFERVYDLECIDKTQIEANFYNCILTIVLPKDKSDECSAEMELAINVEM